MKETATRRGRFPHAARLLAAVILSLVFCVTARASDWSMLMGGPAHTGYTAGAVSAPLTLKWQYTGGGAFHGSPAKAGYLAYIGGSNGVLHAVHTLTGNLIWQYNGNGRVAGAPAIDGNTLVFTTWQGYVYALDAAGGSLYWSRDMGGQIMSSPTVYNGRVYVSVGTPADKVAALDLDTGAVVWEFTASQPFFSSPSVSGGMVWAGCDDGRFYGLNADTGASVASFQTAGLIYTSTPAIDNGVVFGAGGEYDLNVYAFNLQTGAPVWTAAPFPGDSLVKISSIAAANGRVFISIGYPDHKLAALDAATGALLWSATFEDVTGQTALPSPIVAGGVVFVPVMSGALKLLDAATGAEIDSIALDGPAHSTPAAADGMVFVSTLNGSLYAYLGTDTAAPTAALDPLPEFVSGPVTITGSAADDSFQSYSLHYGAGAEPAAWEYLQYSNLAVENGALADWYTGALADGVYSIRLTADDNSGLSASASLMVTVDNTPPVFAGLASASDDGNGDSITLSWTAASDNYSTPSYYIFKSTAPGIGDPSTPDYTATGTSYQITGLEQNTTYYFVVRAVDAAGNRDANAVELSAAPTIPGDETPPVFGGIVSAVASDADGSVALAWNEAVDPSAPVFYRIYAAETSGGQTFGTPTVSISAATHTFTGLIDAKTYYYVVRAVDAAGNEDANTVELSVAAVDTTAPALTVAQPDEGQLFSSANTTIIGSVTPGSTLEINGQSVAPGSDGAFSAALVLAEGANALNFSAADPSGNVATKLVTVYLDSMPPLAELTSPADGATVSGPVAITGTASDANVANWKLEYAPAVTQSGWKTIASSSASVTGGALGTWAAGALGGDYIVRLSVTDDAGVTSTDIAQVTVTNVVTVSGSIPAGEWRMITLPMEMTNAAPAAVFGSSGYKIIRWDPAKTDPDPVGLNYVSPAALAPGEAFFIKAYNAPLSYTATGILPDTTSDFSASLGVGWNQVGSPYDRAFAVGSLNVRRDGVVYTFDDAAAAGLVSSALFSYDGGGYSQALSADTLTNGDGFYVRAYEEVELLFDSTQPAPVSAGRGLAKIVRPREKALRISAKAGGLTDNDNFLSVSPDAADDFDSKDVEEPPLGADRRLSLYFDTADARASGKLATDARLTFGNSKEWDLSVETNESGGVTLSWDASALIAEGYTMLLTDVTAGVTVDMNAVSEYSYTPDGSIRKFRVTVTSGAARRLTTVARELSPGWNLVAFPVEPEATDAVTQLGDDLPAMNVYQFHARKFYTTRDEEGVDIQAGIGYWVHVDQGISVEVEGAPTDPAIPVEVPLANGWNLIGNPYDAALPWGDNIQVIYSGSTATLSEAAALGWLDGVAYRYSDGAYSPAVAELEPGAGYAIKSNSTCKLILKY